MSTDVTEHDILTNQPENLNVGQLNNVVRALREKLYQQALLVQESGNEAGDSDAARHRNIVRAAIYLYHSGHMTADEVFGVAMKEIGGNRIGELGDSLLTARYEAERRFIEYLGDSLKI